MSDDDFSPEDTLAALRAQLDQAAKQSHDVAHVAWAMFAANRAEGFSDSQAIYLVAAQLTCTPGKAP